MEPIVLFGIQFTFCLVAYSLFAWWYGVPRLSRLPREAALVPLVWIHVFRMVGGTILALAALVALRVRWPGAIALVWLFLAVGLVDTVNAIIQSMRFSVFTDGLGFNWIVTAYVPALLVSSVLIFIQLRRPAHSTT
jgi:hypothetical protein